MFSKRHYEFLARWFASATILTSDPRARRLFAESLADRLAHDNPRFDRTRFLKAADVVGAVAPGWREAAE